jgi:hypothetical protein
MKHDIDLFGNNPNYPPDHRWDRDQNSKLLNIVFQTGTFGNFLRYFLERFSTKTPNITENPFTEIGTSHVLKPNDFSGLIQKYHQWFIKDNEGNTNLPICLITTSTEKHHLYLKKAQLFRVGDHKISPDDLWSKPIGEMPERLKNSTNSIIELYDIKDTAHFTWIPKFIVRDWYKLEFLQDLKDTYNYQWSGAFENHEFFNDQKVFRLDLETFFDWDTFVENITELNDMFDLDLDFDQQAEMKELFNKGLSLDIIRQECNLAEDVLDNRSDLRLNQLDVSTEAFIYAEMEKANPDIQMPLTNRFFRDAEEIRQFIEHYPNWYRRPNPNIK